ncbi:MAG: GNAT family N-acetyltransferase [Bacteroidota bacterium]
MIQLVRTNSKDADFRKLVSKLDAYLKVIDGDEHEFYHQFNSVDHLDHAVIAYSDSTAIGCGAFKVLTADCVEIKRMYVLETARGKQVATKILTELELWAHEEGFRSCRLETGLRMPDAIGFYQKNNYQPIANYGPYIGVANSRCFEKIL